MERVVEEGREAEENEEGDDGMCSLPTLLLVEVHSLCDGQSSFHCYRNRQPIFDGKERAESEFGESATDVECRSISYDSELGENDNLVREDEDDEDGVDGQLKEVEATAHFSEGRATKCHCGRNSAEQSEQEDEDGESDGYFESS
ncbi:unnamed protein product, partial [Didymodactylos carnosus]